MTTVTATGRDGCAVETALLSPLVAFFVDVWQRDRPATGGQFASGTAPRIVTITAYEWLEAAASVSQDMIEKIVRYRPDRRTTSPFVELRVADRLVSAIGRPDVFYDGAPPTLPIIPNPRASAQARAGCVRELAGCCGGSSSLVA